jgi:manganese/zinc/iron transport system permease protein
VTGAQLEIQAIAVVTAAACALPGTFLVLRRMAMASDAIGHSILLGIVLAFFITKDLTSPFLVVAAALTGVLTVFLVETLTRSALVRQDAAMGLVFPALFAVAVLLIARYAGGVHLDVDAVLLGELAFAPFNRLSVMGWDVGPKALYMMSAILFINAAFIGLFYKELKLSTFDPALAETLGFSPARLHYGLMFFTSLTAVGAFDAVGSVLVVALMAGSAATAYLIAEGLAGMLFAAAAAGAISALLGYQIAHALDASIAGSIAAAVGVVFAAAFLFSPRRGVVRLLVMRSRRKIDFSRNMLLLHVMHHEGHKEAEVENAASGVYRHLKWDRVYCARVMRRAGDDGLVVIRDGALELTEAGRAIVRDAMVL